MPGRFRPAGGASRDGNSAGIYRQGLGFSPKPAWHAFTRFTGGEVCGACSPLGAGTAARRSRRSTS